MFLSVRERQRGRGQELFAVDDVVVNDGGLNVQTTQNLSRLQIRFCLVKYSDGWSSCSFNNSHPAPELAWPSQSLCF